MNPATNTTTNSKPGNLASLIAMAEAVARMTFAWVYLWDESRQRFLYISASSDLFGSLSATRLMAMSLDEFKAMVPDDDLRLLRQVFQSIKANYSRIPVSLRSEMVLYLNFQIGHGNRGILFNLKISWLDFDDYGYPNIIFGIGTPSVHRTERNIFLKIESADVFRTFDSETGLWNETYRINVTDDERRMLRLSKSGFSAMEIASIMNKSADTVNFYRKSVYKKLGVKNISEAVSHAVHYGII